MNEVTWTSAFKIACSVRAGRKFRQPRHVSAKKEGARHAENELT